MNLQHN